ncbi:hypothetical protein N7493_006719 [Penicillium malachiteum]|uniref:DUF1918 domain-containing protein n=1 Tax=Penicillium malachiteum TaxID=1324776 RepID=A0AAD6HJ80_9EURO|nr:hypothetical protein N7493_006719 [Penicillium malachiteum]
MPASVGESQSLQRQKRNTGEADKTGEIVEVLGGAGNPPYKFDDRHESIVVPGPDAQIISASEE